MNTRPGFTLIEVLVALAVGAMVLLMAFVAVRSAWQTAREVQRQGRINDLLRQGYFQTMNEADFWDSHANPEYPFMQSKMSEVRPDAAGALSGNSPLDKRPFRAVQWSAYGAADPHRLVPGTPASWHRTGVMGGLQPLPRARRIGWAFHPAWHTVLDATNPCQETMQWFRWAWVDPDGRGTRWLLDTENSRVLSQYFEAPWNLPAGWDPWHLIGDYAAVGNVHYEPETRSEQAYPAGNKCASVFRAFGALGHLGVLAYLSPGTFGIVMRPTTNRHELGVQGASAVPFDWGEVPWALARAGTGYSPVNMSRPSVAEGTPATKVDQPLRYNLSIGGPGISTRWFGAIVEGANPPRTSELLDHSEDSGSPNNYWLIDYQAASGSGRQPIAAMYGNRPMRGPTAVAPWDDTELDWLVMDPFRSITNFSSSGYEMRKLDDPSPNKHGSITYLDWFHRYAARTGHVPRIPTNADVGAARAGGVETMRMSTAVARMYHAGSDRALLSIRINDAERDIAYETSFCALGANLRGARATWGVRSLMRPGMQPMGDR